MEHTGLFFLFTCQPTKNANFSRSDVNVCAHLLRKNCSRNFSSIRSGPVSLLANEFDVRSVFQGQVSLAAVNQICVIHEVMNGCKKNLKIRYRIASKM